ncbi:hypothetical protein QE422_002176 [Chryseobacterium sp. SORGH_AS 447]|uniref:hypothetical protein n=1 Tax=Chryseobacterium sp. SORGH_AS_0447 TaxID=3041769 RepID=UPI002786F2CD|nr:hypothetical protein [Chryseobacterium sp. SORGH_AS_0447]MDQ1161808.1 hypothetical protein [Chryseobacterium sp. SORGH_AS_0447]
MTPTVKIDMLPWSKPSGIDSVMVSVVNVRYLRFRKAEYVVAGKLPVSFFLFNLLIQVLSQIRVRKVKF